MPKQLIHNHRSRGFTLIELLIVIAIIGVIVGLSVWGLAALPQRARIQGTKGLIAKLDADLSSKLDRFNERRKGITPQFWELLLAAGDANRAQIIAYKRALSQEFPDTFIVDPNSSHLSDGQDNDGDNLIDEQDEMIIGPWNRIDANNDGIPDQPGPTLPAAAVAYREYMENNFATNPGFASNHRGATARAECLYMILAGVGGEGTLSGASFAAGEVGDTDGDGLMEILDKWGNPVQFFLWPSYYSSPKQHPGLEVDQDDRYQVLTQPPTGWWSTNMTERLNFERLFHTTTHFLPSGGGGAQPKGFATYPLIVSAGPDEGFGFHTLITTGSMTVTYFGGTYTVMAPEGLDGIYGTTDDAVPIGWMLSPGPDGTAGTTDDTDPMISPALRMRDPTIEGYGMDRDNVDNHSLRAG